MFILYYNLFYAVLAILNMNTPQQHIVTTETIKIRKFPHNSPYYSWPVWFPVGWGLNDMLWQLSPQAHAAGAVTAHLHLIFSTGFRSGGIRYHLLKLVIDIIHNFRNMKRSFKHWN